MTRRSPPRQSPRCWMTRQPLPVPVGDDCNARSTAWHVPLLLPCACTESLMNHVSRRRFLKITGAGAGVAAAAGTLGSLPGLRAARGPVEKGIRTVPTFCDLCFWKCNAIATVQRRRPLEDRGQPRRPALARPALPARHRRRRRPLRPRPPARPAAARQRPRRGEVDRGHLGRGARPRRREDAEDQGRVRPGGGRALQPRHRRRRSSSTRSRPSASPNIAAPSFAQCRGPRDVGFELTFGEAIGSPERTDIANARCLVLIGSHLGENMHNTQVQEFAEAIGSGATIIVADPRFSIAASKAKHYLPIKPGTDLALLLAWMNVLVAEGLYDQEYVAAHGFGFEAFAAEIAAVHAGVGLPRDRHRAGRDPRDRARDGAAPPGDARAPGPPRDLVRRRRAAQPRDRAAERAARQLGTQGRLLPAGQHGRARPIPTRPTRSRRRGKVDNPDHRYPFASEAITTGIREATLTGKPYPVKGWFVYATNLIQALPNEAETIRAIQALDLLVVVDVVRQRDRGLGRRRAARGHLPRALRRAERRAVPRAVRGAAPAGRRRRPPTRSRTGGSPASSR